MFDLLQMAWWRLRRPDSLEAALKQLFAAGELRRARAGAECAADLPVLIAAQLRLQPEVLLKELAYRLALPFTRELCVPSAALIAQTHYSAQYLAAAAAVPQPSVRSPAGWMLVAADPFTVEVEQYESRGIAVCLGLSTDIAAIWEKRRLLLAAASGQQLSSDQLFAVLEQLAADAASRGAHEVFVGHPEESKYEFMGADGRYSGSIGRQVYDALLALFAGGKTELTHRVAAAEDFDLHLALTKNYDHPVIYFGWQSAGPAAAAEPAAETAQTSAGTPASEAALHRSAEQQEPAPLLQPPEPQLEAAKRPAAAPIGEPPAPPSVLLVDDDHRFSAILSGILHRRGYLVDARPDGSAALAFLSQRQQQPDLIICDIHMPHTDGAQFLRQLRARGRHTPILMLTSDEDAGLEVELVQLGADAYVHKQEDLRILLAWCSNLSGRGQNGFAVERPQ